MTVSSAIGQTSPGAGGPRSSKYGSRGTPEVLFTKTPNVHEGSNSRSIPPSAPNSNVRGLNPTATDVHYRVFRVCWANRKLFVCCCVAILHKGP